MKTSVKISPVNMEERRSLDMRAGDTVRITVKIKEKDKTRLQAFEGLVLARKHGHEAGATFTVRKVASGVGVERVFPLYSPSIEKIEIVKRTKTRRSKLYYIRDKAAREIRRKMRTERAAMSQPELPEEQSADEGEEIVKEIEETVEFPETRTEEEAEKEDVAIGAK